MSPLGLVLTIIVLAGTAGGLASFLRKRDGADNDPPAQPLDFLRFIAMGVIAAFTLPLFLSLAKSELIPQILTATTDAPRYSEMLILAGFCIVAALSAGPFLDRLSNQIIQELKEKAEKAETKAEKAETKAEKAETKVDNVQAEVERWDEKATPSAQSTERALSAEPSEDLLSEVRNLQLAPEQFAALTALTVKAYRTRSGIAEDAGVPKAKVSEMLESLIDKKLVEPTTSPNTGGRRYKITDLGRAALRLQG